MPRGRHNTIADPIASDTWSYLGKDGLRHTVEIIIGRPFAITSGEIPKWECPLYIQDMTLGVKHIRGVGPVDALLNATTIVKTILAGLPDATPMEGHD